MKRFLILLKHEYNGIFLPLCIIIAVMAVLQSVLFGWYLRELQGYAPFSYVIENSGVGIVFSIVFIGLLALVGVRFAMNFMPSKNIYALMALPLKRRYLYLSKLLAALLAGFLLVSVQMALLLIFDFVMGMHDFGIVAGVEITRRNADFYLSLVDTSFLRMLFPPDMFSLAFSWVGFFGTICITLYSVVRLKASRSPGVILKTALLIGFWLVGFITAFPLSLNSMRVNVGFMLIALLITIVTCRKGIKLFESGEVVG